MPFEHIKIRPTEPTGPIEQEPWFDTQTAEYSARQTDKSDKKVTGSIWDIQFMSTMDGVLHFAVVLKIDTDSYQPFHSEKEAIDHKILQGFPDVAITIRHRTRSSVYRPEQGVKVRLFR